MKENVCSISQNGMGLKHEKTIRQSKALDQVIVQLMKAFKQHE
ncbi:MAG TPA: Spo0E family sporulation regulatory protein-aspartic acid phosphatase [Firmicutes bacterium]|nr:Spo0E family sporulation regulatory protein-aspartic acid phosphatase [Bacillota bacterium]